MKAKVFGTHAGLMSFVLGFTLLASLTVVEVTCPVCKGTGVLSGTQDFEITGVKSELVSHEIVELQCGWDFERFTYNVTISVVNETATPIYGTVLVTFRDPESTRTAIIEVEDEPIEVTSTGGTVASVPIFVEIAAETAQTIEETIVFQGVTLELFGLKAHLVQVNKNEEFVCPYSGGTGKVPFIEWIRLI